MWNKRHIRLRLVGYGVMSWLFCLSQNSSAQWTNPNPTSAVSVAIMVSTGATGAVQGPKTVSGFTSVGSDRFVAEELMLNAVLIDEWSDLAGASILNLAQYVTGASSVTAPGAPYANVLQSGAAPGLTFSRIKGQSGITASNGPDGNIYLDGGATSSVEALFPRQTMSVTRIYYRSITAPYDMTYFDTPTYTSGYFYIDGTTPVFRSTVAVGNATNADLFAGQLPGYYADFFNLTNVLIWDDATVEATDVMGFEAGVNADWELVTRTNNGRTSTVARMNIAGGSNDLGRLASSNAWTEYNSFEDDTYFFSRILRTGHGITIADGASVGSGSSNLTASGSQSTVAGGFANTASGENSTSGGGLQNTASGAKSTAAGGYNNAASGTGSAIGGGQNNNAGDYSAASGGDNVDVTGQYSAGPGGLNISATKNYELIFGRNLASTNADGLMFAWGDVETNRLKSVQDRAVVFLWEGTNRGRLGFNTANPTANVHVVGSVMADQYYGSFLGDISGASGAPVASNSQFTLETIYGTNGATRRLVFVGAAVTNVLVSGNTTTVYFADSLGGGGGSANLTSTWAVAVTLGSTNAVMIPYAASNTLLASTGATSTPAFKTAAQLGLVTTESDPVFAGVSNSLQSQINAKGTGTLIQSSVQDVYVRVSGETNIVVLTGATVRVREPSAGSDAATKAYVDSGGAAGVTNAISKMNVNGTDYTGLSQLNLNNAAASASQAGPTVTVTMAQTPINTNMAFAGYTISNASQVEVVQIPTTNHLQAGGRVTMFDDRARQHSGASASTAVRTIPNLAMTVDASNGMGWVSTVVQQTNGTPNFALSGVAGPSSSYQPGFSLSTASRAGVYNGANGTFFGAAGKTAGDEDLALVMFRGVDEADMVLYAVPGTAADTTSATATPVFKHRYVEGGTGVSVQNIGKSDWDFIVSGVNSVKVLAVDSATDCVVIRDPGSLWYSAITVTNGAHAALVVNGAVHIQGTGGNLKLANAGQATMTSGVCIVTMPVAMPDTTYIVHPIFLDGGAVAGLAPFNLTNRTTTAFTLETVSTYSGTILFNVIDY